MIIGIAGTLAAGKGEVVAYLKSKGFKHYSSSAILKEILTQRGLPLTRDYMSPLADELMEKYPGGILSLSFERATQDQATDFVLEALHRKSEADFVRSLGGKIIGVDADVEKRFQRTVARGDGAKDQVTHDQFLTHVEHEDEGKGATGSHIREVLNTADAVIMNNGTLEDLHAEVDKALARIV